MRSAARTVANAAQLEGIVERLASEIAHDHPLGLVVIGVLNSSVVFVADLIRRLEVQCTVDFLALSRYVGASERVRIVKDLDLNVADHDVVLIEGVVDTGLSSRYVADLLRSRGARHVSLCALFDRPARRILPIDLRYVGRTVGEEFLVGYGLDYAQRYRNLRDVVATEPSSLEENRKAFENLAYRSAAERE